MKINTLLNNIEKIDNIKDLNAAIHALKAKQKSLKWELANEARSAFSNGQSVKVNTSNGVEFGVIKKIQMVNATVEIDGQLFRCPLSILEAA